MEDHMNLKNIIFQYFSLIVLAALSLFPLGVACNQSAGNEESLAAEEEAADEESGDEGTADEGTGDEGTGDEGSSEEATEEEESTDALACETAEQCEAKVADGIIEACGESQTSGCSEGQCSCLGCGQDTDCDQSGGDAHCSDGVCALDCTVEPEDSCDDSEGAASCDPETRECFFDE